MTDEPTDRSDPDQDTPMRGDTAPDAHPETPAENIVHFNPWRDFNDAARRATLSGTSLILRRSRNSCMSSSAIATG